jgi:nucleoside-diphosphate-sugar epimerase
MKILLTGAGGFIGSAVLPLLLQTGHDVTVLTRPASVTTIRQTLTTAGHSCQFLPAEPADWAQAVGQDSFELCLHLAWIATPGLYLTSPENETFADATLALAEQLYAQGTRHFIGTGTCIEYAPGITAPCQENHTPTGPLSPYGQAKLRTCQGLQALAETAGAGWTWARIFYPYGIGEHPARTASTFLRTLAAGQPLSLKTGASIKDWIEINDLASALLHLTRTGPQGIINLGTGTPASILDLALLAARLTHADPALVQNTGDGTDPYAFHLADPTKLFSTGWSPAIPLEIGLVSLLNSIPPSIKLP